MFKVSLTSNLFLLRPRCIPCKKSYARRQSFQTHMRLVHNETDKSLFVCSKCPKRFSTEKKVKVHEAVHLPDDMKMIHPCPYCDKKFTKSINVQAHIRAIHENLRPFICEGGRLSYLFIKHIFSNYYYFCITECGKSFGTKGKWLDLSVFIYF